MEPKQDTQKWPEKVHHADKCHTHCVCSADDFNHALSLMAEEVRGRASKDDLIYYFMLFLLGFMLAWIPFLIIKISN